MRTTAQKIVCLFEGAYLPVRANVIGLYHLLRGHHTRWFKDPDLWCAHLGWIECTDCPDCEGADLCIWGFHFHRVHRLVQLLCGALGHEERKEALESSGRDDEEGYPIFDKPSGHFYCSRCLADM